MGQDAEWVKSSRSGAANATCVELSRSGDRVRDSKNPSGPVLPVDVPRFVAAIKSGRFDLS